MRSVVTIAAAAFLAAGCAGRARPEGPTDLPARDSVVVPAETGGEVVPVQPPAPAPQPRDLVPLALPAGIAADDFDITLEYNGRVEYWLQYFQRYHDTFAGWLERMSRYEPFIRRELTSAGLPGDLIYLGLIESGFTPGATSSARAVGIWQLMAETARDEGLEISTYIDERRDPIRATGAAVRHLRALYRELGSWYLVAAAYNSGSGRVGRALDANAGGARGADSLFWRIEPVLPTETRDYVPKFLAAAILAKYPDRFGVTPGPLPGPDDFDVVRIARATDLEAIARAARAPEELIRRLNPQFYQGVTPPRRTVAVRVPAGSGARLLARLAQMPARARVHDLHYTANAGDTPGSVARRYGVSLAALRKANHLKKKTKVFAEGRRVVIPLAPPVLLASEEGSRSPERKLAAAGDPRPETQATASDAKEHSDSAAERNGEARPGAASENAPKKARKRSALSSADAPARAGAGGTAGVGSYRVRAGDTLSRIAEAHGTTVARLRELNGLGRGSVIKPGQELRLSRTRVLVYRVHEGDTLWRIARKHGVTVEELRDWNDLSPGATLRPGDEVDVHLPGGSGP